MMTMMHQWQMKKRPSLARCPCRQHLQEHLQKDEEDRPEAEDHVLLEVLPPDGAAAAQC